MKDYKYFYQKAFSQAQKSLQEGGIPIGAVLVCDDEIIGQGHNQRVQKKSAILHGEMDALENAGRLTANQYQRCTLYTTLSPCAMCTGTILLYKIPKVIIGENQNFQGQEQLLLDNKVEIMVLQDEKTITLMKNFIASRPELWFEDIGLPSNRGQGNT